MVLKNGIKKSLDEGFPIIHVAIIICSNELALLASILCIDVLLQLIPYRKQWKESKNFKFPTRYISS